MEKTLLPDLNDRGLRWRPCVAFPLVQKERRNENSVVSFILFRSALYVCSGWTTLKSQACGTRNEREERGLLGNDALVNQQVRRWQGYGLLHLEWRTVLRIVGSTCFQAWQLLTAWVRETKMAKASSMTKLRKQ